MGQSYWLYMVTKPNMSDKSDFNEDLSVLVRNVKKVRLNNVDFLGLPNHCSEVSLFFPLQYRNICWWKNKRCSNGSKVEEKKSTL